MSQYEHIAATNGYFRASFTLLRTDDGGRESAIGRDYRPNWSIGEPNADAQAGAPMTTERVDSIAPGETADVMLFPIWPQAFESVEPGTQLFAFEGRRLIGRAVVTAVIPPEASASR